jgi:hypothetical protein
MARNILAILSRCSPRRQLHSPLLVDDALSALLWHCIEPFVFTLSMLWRRLADGIVLALSLTMPPLMLHCALCLGEKRKEKKK